jgi:hypothetical protein
MRLVSFFVISSEYASLARTEEPLATAFFKVRDVSTSLDMTEVVESFSTRL